MQCAGKREADLDKQRQALTLAATTQRPSGFTPRHGRKALALAARCNRDRLVGGRLRFDLPSREYSCRRSTKPQHVTLVLLLMKC